MKLSPARFFLLIPLLGGFSSHMNPAKADSTAQQTKSSAVQQASQATEAAALAAEQTARATAQKTNMLRACADLQKSVLARPVDGRPLCGAAEVENFRNCTNLLAEDDKKAATAYLEEIYKTRSCALYSCTLANLYSSPPNQPSNPDPATAPSQSVTRDSKQIEYTERCLSETKNDTPLTFRETLRASLPRRELRQKSYRLHWAGISLLGFTAPSLLIGSSVLAGFDTQPTGRTDCFFAGVQQPCVYNFQALYITGFALTGAAVIAGGISFYFSKRTWEKYRTGEASPFGSKQ